ncbi:MAG: AMP-binding protein [Deltaproteobacteria bacterium]|nr:AMP-binding protein [Deltaproteobacteria bacterium]
MNIVSYVSQHAKLHPHQLALTCGKTSIDFITLDSLSTHMAQNLKRWGLQKGHRVVLLIRPSIELIALTFALFKLGVVCVLIDPGIGRAHLKKCIQDVSPNGFFAIPKAHVLRWIWPSVFRSTPFVLWIGQKFGLKGRSLRHLLKTPPDPIFLPEETSDADLAAIIFTTGSTGAPKGVAYEHGMFDAQVKILKESFGITSSDIDLPTFPLFALFSLALGAHCVVPNMDPMHPAHVYPPNILQQIQKYHVTFSFGSPALWHNVTQYCLKENIKLPSLKKIFIAGAPVPLSLLDRFETILEPTAEVYTPYGATEALPISVIERKKIQPGFGNCVGTIISPTRVLILRITDQALEKFTEKDLLPPNSVGEITVSGPQVTKTYYNHSRATQFAKVKDAQGNVWHRMGDVGYLDDRGQLWFCGRKVHLVKTSIKTYFSVPCENIFNQHPEVYRSALISFHRQPAIVIELKHQDLLRQTQKIQELTEALKKLARASQMTQDIQSIFFHPSFPVDIRHNAKINREMLRLWAEQTFS